MISRNQSSAIEYLRVISMLLIVTCHFLQAFRNDLCWIFNIGVQIFLALSGFLYSSKEIVNIKTWYVNRFVRIYVPYALFLIVVLPASCIVTHQFISFKNLFAYVFVLQGFFGGLSGLGHLWFLTAILICYLLLPFIKKHINISPLIIIFSLLSIYIGYNLLFTRYRLIIGGISIYYIAYYYAKLNIAHQRWFCYLSLLFFALIMTRFSLDRVVDDMFYSSLFHLLLCLSIFLTTLTFINFSLPKTSILNWLDSNSYDIYITHQIFILGPMAILCVQNISTINIIITILAILVSAYILHITSERVSKPVLSFLLKVFGNDTQRV